MGPQCEHRLGARPGWCGHDHTADATVRCATPDPTWPLTPHHHATPPLSSQDLVFVEFIANDGSEMDVSYTDNQKV